MPSVTINFFQALLIQSFANELALSHPTDKVADTSPNLVMTRAYKSGDTLASKLIDKLVLQLIGVSYLHQANVDDVGSSQIKLADQAVLPVENADLDDLALGTIQQLALSRHKSVIQAPRLHGSGVTSAYQPHAARVRHSQSFGGPLRASNGQADFIRPVAQQGSSIIASDAKEPANTSVPLERLSKQMESEPEPMSTAATAHGPSGLTRVTRGAVAGATRALTGSPGTIIRNLLLAGAAAKLAMDGRSLEAAYSLGLIPVLQQVLDGTGIGSWTAFASLSHRFTGVATLAIGPLVAAYFMVSGESNLPPSVVYPILLVGMLNPITGVVLVNKNLANADMGLLRTFATGYQGALCAAAHGLLLYTLPDAMVPQLLFLAFATYHFVCAWADSFIHASKLRAGTSQYDESIALETLPGGLKYPENVWDMWRRAPRNPESGSPYENILWRAFVYNRGEKEDHWSAAPSNVPTTAVAWSVSLPATTYFLVALSYVLHGAGPIQEYIGGLDYNFQGILATTSLLAVAQNNLGVFLYSLLLHKKMPQPVVWGVYGASWALFITYVVSEATRYPAYFNDYLTFLSPLSQLPH